MRCSGADRNYEKGSVRTGTVAWKNGQNEREDQRRLAAYLKDVFEKLTKKIHQRQTSSHRRTKTDNKEQQSAATNGS